MCNGECAEEYSWLRESGEELMNSIIVWLQQRAHSRRAALHYKACLLCLPSLPAFLACLPAARGDGAGAGAGAGGGGPAGLCR